MLSAGEAFYKGCKAVRLENEALRVIVLPSIGGKIASIFHKGKNFELLFQNEGSAYRKAGLYDTFETFDASGFDDAFPSIESGKVKLKNGTVPYPDHGEIWSKSFNCELREGSAILSAQSAILPYRYKKTVTLKGGRVCCGYEITNTGTEAFPCLWAMHCLIRCEEDMRLLFPAGTREVLNVRESTVLGKKDTLHPFPAVRLAGGREYRLDRVLPAGANTCEKYYVNGKVTEGLAGAYYPKEGCTYRIRFDKEKLPYLGFWVTQGGFRGDYNCALEPSNGFYDSIACARKRHSLFILKEKEKLAFDLAIELE